MLIPVVLLKMPCFHTISLLGLLPSDNVLENGSQVVCLFHQYRLPHKGYKSPDTLHLSESTAYRGCWRTAYWAIMNILTRLVIRCRLHKKMFQRDLRLLDSSNVEVWTLHSLLMSFVKLFEMNGMVSAVLESSWKACRLAFVVAFFPFRIALSSKETSDSFL